MSTFTQGVEETRPGVYIDFIDARKYATSLSERGTVIIPIVSPTYGPLNTFIEINQESQDAQFAKLGYNIIDTKMLMLFEAFKAAKTILAYIPGTGGTKAKATSAPITVEAKYVGTRGNDFKFSISDHPVSGKLFQVFIGTTVVFKSEQVVNIADIPVNDFVTVTGTGALANVAATSLTGGTDCTSSNSDITSFLSAVETQKADALCFPYTDATLAAAFDTKMRYYNESADMTIQGVRPKGTVAADNEYVTAVKNAPLLDNGIQLTPEQTCAYVAAVSASATCYQSNTRKKYPNAIDVYPRLTNTEIKTALKSGEFVFTLIDNEVVIEQDINSLTTLTATKGKQFKKNRFVRTMFEFVRGGEKVMAPNRYDGNADGYALAKQELVSLLLAMEKVNAITNVDKDNDVVFDPTLSIGEDAYITVGLQGVDAIEKSYITVKCR